MSIPLSAALTRNNACTQLTVLSLQANKKQVMYKKPSYVAEFGIGDEVYTEQCFSMIPASNRCNTLCTSGTV